MTEKRQTSQGYIIRILQHSKEINDAEHEYMNIAPPPTPQLSSLLRH
jgi:hypothetical protein